MRNQKGFTIIELVVVMAVIVILSAFTYPRIAGYIKMKNDMQRENHEYLVNKALMQYYALTGRFYRAPYVTNESMLEPDAAAMVSELAEKTGALIEDPTGKYEYVKTDGYDDPDDNSKCTIRTVKVKIQ